MTKKSIENYLVYTFFIFARCFKRAQSAKKEPDFTGSFVFSTYPVSNFRVICQDKS